jgi:hypothetical protein
MAHSRITHHSTAQKANPSPWLCLHNNSSLLTTAVGIMAISLSMWYSPGSLLKQELRCRNISALVNRHTEWDWTAGVCNAALACRTIGTLTVCRIRATEVRKIETNNTTLCNCIAKTNSRSSATCRAYAANRRAATCYSADTIIAGSSTGAL